MDTPGNNPNDPRNIPDTTRDRVVTPTPTYGSSVYVAEQNEDVTLPIKNRIQWGPIIGGLVSALAIFLLLTILGIAIGASVLDPNNAGDDAGIFSALWGAISVIVAFFVGGWVAAKSSAVGGSFGGLMNGLLVGATGLLLVIWLTFSGLGALFGTLSSSVGGIISAAAEVASSPAGQEAAQEAEEEGVTTEEVQEEAGQAVEEVQETVESIEPEEAFETVRNSAFGTFLGMLLPILAAGLGGYLGHNTRYDILTGGGS